MSTRFSPDTLISVAAHINHEYGMAGYRISPRESTIGGGGLFDVHHSDGSEFRLVADKWGNVSRLPDHDGYSNSLTQEQWLAAEEFFTTAGGR